MGEDGDGDPQRIKKIAAAAYDYDSDPRWSEYWSNVLVPPHMASRSDVVDHYKRKFYQRHIDPNYIVEGMASSRSSSSSQSPPELSRRSPLSTSAAENATPRDSGSSAGTSRQQGRAANSVPLDRRSIHFSVNAWVLFVSVLGMLPIIPKSFSSKAYRLSLLGTTCSSLYSIYTLYGKPRAWNMQGLQSWFQNIIATKEFIRLIYCLTFVTAQLYLKFALIPVLIWALEHVARFLRRNFTGSSLYRRYLEEACLWVETNTTTLGIMSSHTEISLGFLLILSLLSWQRSIIHSFMYWQLLKLMYHAPVTATYHRSAWSKIGQAVNPYIHRYAPFLNRPVSAVQRWWFR